MAEGVFRHKLKVNGLENQVKIDSAGTGGWHEGEPPDSRAVSCMKAKGIDISDLRARQVDTSDFTNFDRIFIMDRQNSNDIRDFYLDSDSEEKVEYLMDLAPYLKVRDVPDPYAGGPDGFEYVFDLINAATDTLIEQVKESVKKK
ncbi:MAG: low molecular weight phosphotyrosine protein phosphatase [Bdellovibrionales bacterium]|nr:low molecular weight phosphotyrosine protein phosphatase [Bdellovibrionales bacterium]